MTAYGLDERFKSPKDCFRLTDPAAYNLRRDYHCKPNKYGFGSSKPRDTLIGGRSYTDKIYDNAVKHRILNATSLMSKTPRFKSTTFNEEEWEEFLCRCGIDNVCECPLAEEPVKQVTCQAQVYKRLFKGPPPHSKVSAGISVPTKRDRGFEILSDGSQRRLLDIPGKPCPPFYNTRVHYSTEFYQGWKWSEWTAPRKPRDLEIRPGPADYSIVKEKTIFELCAEKTKEYKRLTSKQPRYIEIVQNRNIKEGRPGPATYWPELAKGTDLQFMGSKANRFQTQKYNVHPSPADYFISRDFDIPKPPAKPCLARLPSPVGFGVKAKRFKNVIKQSPGPADYNAGVTLCNTINYSRAPLGGSALRFKKERVCSDEESGEEDIVENEGSENNKCPNFTWQFRSKTKRFGSGKTFDFYITNISKSCDKKIRPISVQILSPFNTSQGRFQPCYNFLPPPTGGETPGPGYYNLEKPKCLPAVNSGPLYRARRLENKFITPAPNEYGRKIIGGVDDALNTHNKNLKNKAGKGLVGWKFKFREEKRELTPDERELAILEKAIRQLELDPKKEMDKEETKLAVEDTECWCDFYATDDEKPKQKLLRTFLYKRPTITYF